MVINTDDAQTTAQIITATIAALNAATPVGDGVSSGNSVYPAGYFDTVTQIGASPAGPIASNNELIGYPAEVIRVT